MTPGIGSKPARREQLAHSEASDRIGMSSLVFANGDRMASLGLGTWKAGAGEVGGAVTAALELGYRHLDCASIYGNEAEIGASLERACATGALQRDQIWITSKLWNDCHAPEDVRPALERSLADLGLATLDLYLIHWPVAHRHGVMMPQQAPDQISLEQRPIAATWSAMEELVRAGLVRHIGVSNFSQAKLAALLAGADLAPEVNQVERHPYLQQPELPGPRHPAHRLRAPGLAASRHHLTPTGRSGDHGDCGGPWRQRGPGAAGLGDRLWHGGDSQIRPTPTPRRQLGGGRTGLKRHRAGPDCRPGSGRALHRRWFLGAARRPLQRRQPLG